MLRSIGSNISETVLTKERHQLVTAGPYRWVRHSLYSVGSTAFAALSLIAANAFMGLFVALAVAAVVAAVIPREEANLERVFGAEYRAYRRRTGRLVPRIRPPADEEQLELGSSGQFWQMIRDRRGETTISRVELEERIASEE